MRRCPEPRATRRGARAAAASCFVPAWLLAAATCIAEPRAPHEPVVRESKREFFDSLSDSAIAPDQNRLYRKQGARREVDIGGGWIASLDEQAPSRVDSPLPGPGVAGSPSRVLGLSVDRPGLFGEIAHARTAVTRESGSAWRWALLDRATLVADWRERRSTLADVDARRRDAALGLRWQLHPDAWLEGGVHRASLEPASGDPAGSAPAGQQTFWRARARWQPASVPGLGLGAHAERALSDPVDPLGGARLEFGADYELQPDNPLGASFAGSRLTWREAPRLGLLSDGNALDPRAAWRRTVGVEVPDGTPGGVVYSQWRSRSLASDDDQLWVLGWRHAWRPSPRWLLQGFVEQAVPIDGPTAERSFAIGGRLWRGAFPDNTFVTDLQLVNSQRDDSLYLGLKYTFRVGDDVLVALRSSLRHQQPHGDPGAGVTTNKGSIGAGWREPQQQRLSVLGRWSFVGTEVGDPLAADRRAHIALVAGSYIVGPQDSVSVRWTHRWEREESRPALDPRNTTMALARWVHELGRRWSVSAHVAQRRDDVDGAATGAGAEIGYALSRRVVLALGYNPRGFDDHELEVDERLDKGLQVRLRLSIDGALARWLDAPRGGAPGVDQK